MSKSWFVTGTDTGVGKTAVSCALLNAAAQGGLRTAAVKPVAAGCDDQGHNEDALQLQSAMTSTLEYSQVNPGCTGGPHSATYCRQSRGQALAGEPACGVVSGCHVR